jgi:flagellar biogenesis protein FliO
MIKYNIYDREQRIDLMLSFTQKITQEVTQNRSDKSVTIMVKDATYHSNVSKTFSNHLIKSIDIIPLEDAIRIDIKSDEKFAHEVSKTIDGYGLRIRMTPFNTTPKVETAIPQMQTPQEEPTKLQTKEDFDYTTYYLVMVVLLILVIILWIVKKRLENNSWLGGKSVGDGLIVHFQKPLDVKTKIALIEYDGMKYLLSVGASSTSLIDKFPATSTSKQGEPKTEFDSHLRLAEDKLNSILNATNQMKS